MSFDISDLLEQWKYEPGQIAARRFKSKAGVEKIQMRVDLGILQMNASGRPDGRRPFGRDTLFEYYEARLKRHLKAHENEDSGFRLSGLDCSRLHQEMVQFHHRYICFFQLRDYASVIRDASRNLDVFEFVKRYSDADELLGPIIHLIPQLLMLRTRAMSMIAVDADDHEGAVEHAEDGLAHLRSFAQEFISGTSPDTVPELISLESFLMDLESTRPLSEREKLKRALEAAVRREDYEKAAELRDSLRKLAD